MASVAPASPPREPGILATAMKESWVEDLEKAENRLQDNVSVVRNEVIYSYGRMSPTRTGLGIYT